MEKSYKPVVLCVLDGFGVSAEEKGNPVAVARKPNLDFIEANYPFTTLQASGVAVGLPWGEAGNSEVGHLTMGAGRVIYHHLPRIIYSISDKSFFSNEAFSKAVEHVKAQNSRLHLLGLVSSGSVHSYIEHIYALLQFVEETGVSSAFLHVITDGKDAPPKEGEKFLASLESRMADDFPHTKVASVVGRFYAMDRDEKWERVEKAYQLYTSGTGENSPETASEYLRRQYGKGLTDEFVEPTLLLPEGQMKDGDALIILNFREDSVREITHAFVDEAFDEFSRVKLDHFLVVTMTEYEKGLNAIPAFTSLNVNEPLAALIAAAGMRQLHIAETEKYAHVTYFFNGGSEGPFPGEDRVLVPSREVTHFEEAPEMKAAEIAARVAESLNTYEFILINFANTDMVGHSGNFNAAVKAVEAVDEAVGTLHRAVIEKGGILIVTGDHGNVEAKWSPVTGERLTEHSINPVPFYLVGNDFRHLATRTAEEVARAKKEAGGILTDVAPTVLELMGIPKPAEMTGTSLLSQLLVE